MLLCPILLPNYDAQSGDPQFTLFQLRSMQKALEQRPDTQPQFLKYIALDPDSYAYDACRWRGVECTPVMGEYPQVTEIVTTFVATGAETNRWRVDVRWLPGSMQFVYVHAMELAGPLHCRALPRALKFFFLRQSLQPTAETLELRYLPLEVEEIHIVDSSVAHTVEIDDLPPKLRILRITSLDLHRAVLGDADAPTGFACRCSRQANPHKVKIEASAASQLRQRLATVGARYSPWAAELKRTCAAIWEEMNGIGLWEVQD